FDLEKGPLFSPLILRLEEKQYLFIFNIHHIINDGWSQGIINNDIITLYNAYRNNKENPLEKIQLQYKDYTRWHNRLIEEKQFEKSGRYWLEKFSDKPNGIELPLDQPRKPIQTFNGGRIEFVVEMERTTRLQERCRQEDITLYMGLLSLLDIFLYKYTGQEDIIIGSPIAGRKQAELHQMIGFLVNTFVIRTRVEPNETAAKLQAKIKEEALASYENQDFPFDLLVEQLNLDRDLSQSPLFNVMLAYNNAETEDSEIAFEEIQMSSYRYSDDFNMSKFDLTFSMNNIPQGISVLMEYNSDLFYHETIERMSTNLSNLLDNLLDEKNRDLPVHTLNILSEPERKKILETFNGTPEDYPPLTLMEMFEQQAQKTPDSISIVGTREEQGTHPNVGGIHESFLNTTSTLSTPSTLSNPSTPSTPSGTKITYRQLNRKANRLATYLRKHKGVKPNDIAGISMERSIHMIVVILGIIKSGAAYLAIDPAYPRERVLHILSDSRTQLVIIDKMRPELFGEYEGELINHHEPVEKQDSGEKEREYPNPVIVTKPSDVLYINYTSGSTGTPNGAMLSHDCLTNLIKWQKHKSGIESSLRCLQFTSINFCVSFQEIMGTITAGGRLYLIGEVQRQDIEYLMDYLGRNQIEILYLPFSYLNF
ncbi:MAG: AMP-binding protein, partial [bacterium]|nr:AMP-binding protein [bacterium]